MGAKRKTLAGFSSAAAVRAGDMHAGFVFYCDVVQQTPPAYRVRAAKLVAAKCTLMARMDAYGSDPAGRVAPRPSPHTARTRAQASQRARSGR